MAAAVGVALVQIENRDAVSTQDRDFNIQLACQLILRSHQTTPARLYVLPELSSIGYAEQVFPNVSSLAETWQGYSFQQFSLLAKQLSCFICYGFPRLTEVGDVVEGSGIQRTPAYTIAQAVVGPSGQLVAAYDKRHACNFGDCTETKYFIKGATPQRNVFEIDGIKFGLTICYDLRFPESFRSLALEHHVDVILHPSSFPMDIASPSWHPFVITRALENQVYVVSLSRAGPHFGKSILCPPWIEGGDITGQTTPVVLDQKQQVFVYTIQKAVVERVRRDYPLRQDRIHLKDAKL